MDLLHPTTPAIDIDQTLTAFKELSLFTEFHHPSKYFLSGPLARLESWKFCYIGNMECSSNKAHPYKTTYLDSLAGFFFLTVSSFVRCTWCVLLKLMQQAADGSFTEFSNATAGGLISVTFLPKSPRSSNSVCQSIRLSWSGESLASYRFNTVLIDAPVYKALQHRPRIVLNADPPIMITHSTAFLSTSWC